MYSYAPVLYPKILKLDTVSAITLVTYIELLPVGIFALVIGGVVLFLAGRLSIDDIVRILEARAGGS